MWFAVAAVLILLVTVVLLVVICRHLSHELKEAYEANEKLYNSDQLLTKANQDLADAIRAQEQGRDEQEENYEQQFLSFTERIDALIYNEAVLKLYIEGLEEIRDFHTENCLPSLMRIHHGLETHEPDV